MSDIFDANLYKPELGKEGISDPVEAITDKGILVHVWWDGHEWHEIIDGVEETYGKGLKEWRKIPRSWIYDDEYYSSGEYIRRRESS